MTSPVRNVHGWHILTSGTAIPPDSDRAVDVMLREGYYTLWMDGRMQAYCEIPTRLSNFTVYVGDSPVDEEWSSKFNTATGMIGTVTVRYAGPSSGEKNLVAGSTAPPTQITATVPPPPPTPPMVTPPTETAATPPPLTPPVEAPPKTAGDAGWSEQTVGPMTFSVPANWTAAQVPASAEQWMWTSGSLSSPEALFFIQGGSSAEEILARMRDASDPLHITGQRATSVAGRPAMIHIGGSSDPPMTAWVVIPDRRVWEGMYVAFTGGAPRARWSSFQPIFERILGSVKIADIPVTTGVIMEHPPEPPPASGWREMTVGSVTLTIPEDWRSSSSYVTDPGEAWWYTGSEEAPEAAFAINRGESADQIISTLGLLYSGMQITERRPATVGGRAATSHVGTSQQPPYRGWITTLNARDGEGKITGFVAGSAPGSWPRWSPVFEKIMASIRIGPGAAAEAPPAGTAAGGTTVLATLANQASENVHIYVEGESCDPGNRLAPGESREVAVKMDSFGRVTFHAGRNGATIATKVWNGDPDSTNRVPRVIFTSYGTLIVLTSLK